MLDLTKPIVTREGLPYTFKLELAAPLRSGKTLIGVIHKSDGDVLYQHFRDGRYHEDGQTNSFDLVNANEEEIKDQKIPKDFEGPWLDAAILAVAVWVDRFRHLDLDAKSDLFELAEVIRTAKTEGELNGAYKAMLEIIGDWKRNNGEVAE